MHDTDYTGWCVGTIVATALIAIGYLVFSANGGPADIRECAATHEETRWVRRDANAEDRHGPYIETWVPLTVTVCDKVMVSVE